MGSVYRRKDGRWVAAWWEQGRKRTRYFKTQVEAEDFLSGQEEAERVMEAAWAWLALRTDLSPSTVATYRRAFRAWEEALGPLRLAALSADRLRSVLADWALAGTGPRALEQRYQALHAFFEDLVEEGRLPSNPLDRVRKPRSRPLRRPLWTLEETKAFLGQALASPRQYSKLLAFLVLTGLRFGEAIGLRWSEVDRDRVRVVRSIVWVDGRPVEGGVKSRASARTVLLSAQARDLLQGLPRLSERVFPDSAGGIPRRENVRRDLQALCREAGVRDLKIHDLRKVHAALLFYGGADPRTVQEQLGHSTAQISLEVYSYVIGPEQASVALDRALRDG